jgi:hypothetical protein
VIQQILGGYPVNIPRLYVPIYGFSGYPRLRRPPLAGIFGNDGVWTCFSRLTSSRIVRHSRWSEPIFRSARASTSPCLLSTAAGLAFAGAPAEEGTDVFAAGFPGLGFEQIWQFSKGIVSNARMRLPRDPVEDAEVNETRFGPFIQHTAPIDSGNSGGPLLVAQAGVPIGYAVAGINARTATRRAATFFAIPADRVLAYINAAIRSRDEAVMR